MVGKIAPNILERDFHVKKPNGRWVRDMTEIQSMSRKGKGYDNPVIESLFDAIKSEFLCLKKFDVLSSLNKSSSFISSTTITSVSRQH